MPSGIPSVTHPGHRRLADGSLTRLDIEHGQYVGRLYTPHLTVRKVVTGYRPPNAVLDLRKQGPVGWGVGVGIFGSPNPLSGHHDGVGADGCLPGTWPRGRPRGTDLRQHANGCAGRFVETDRFL